MGWGHPLQMESWSPQGLQLVMAPKSKYVLPTACPFKYLTTQLPALAAIFPEIGFGSLWRYRLDVYSTVHFTLLCTRCVENPVNVMGAF
jgi:hypothetical protein